MYILKNAWKNITRNKSRNILIGIIIVVLAASISVTLAICNTSSKLIESYKNSQDVEATISVNRENMRSQMRPPTDGDSSSFKDRKDEMSSAFKEASKISVEDIEKYGNSEYVKSYYYTLQIGVNGSDLTKVSMSSNSESKGNMPSFPGGVGGKEDFRMGSQSNSDFTLVGYSTIEAMKDFIDGSFTITDGSVFSDFDGTECLINSELAEANDLKVGDKITLVDPNNEDITMEYTISGIYEDKSSNQDNAMSMFTNSANQIITNSSAVTEFVSKDEENISVTTTPTFILKSADDVDAFSKELTEKGLSEYLSVSTNLDEVESATSTISNVRNFSKSFLIIAVIIGAIVLFVINMINIRERKYEIGVLRTIGMKKATLCFQFMAELFIITIFGLMIGAGIGTALSVPVSNSLLKNEISSSETKMENVKSNFGGGDNFPGMPGKNGKSDKKFNGFVSVQAFDSIDATVDFKVLAELLLIGIALTFISSSASMIAIERFQPLEILKERS